jgi:hypothetical protein
MRRGELTDDEVIARVRQGLASCQPSIAFDSIEAGDFEDGRLFVALINFFKQGNGTLEAARKRNAFQIRDMVVSALNTLAGQASVPSFSIQDIISRNKVETMKLLSWIVKAGERNAKVSNALLPVHVSWIKRLGIGDNVTEPVSRFAAIAERFRLRGEPFTAFRNAGIVVPDDPIAATVAVFKAANGRCADEIQFVYDDEIEAELVRLTKTVTTLAARTADEMSAEGSVVRETVGALETLKTRLTSVRVTTALKARTDQTLNDIEKELNRLRQTIDAHERRQRQQRDQALKESKEAAANLEAKISQTEDAIAKVKALAVSANPNTIAGMESRIQRLSLEKEETHVREIESNPGCNPTRASNLRTLLTEAKAVISRRRAELESILHIVTVVLEIDKKMDERNGNFEARSALLQSQTRVLQTNRFFDC